MSVPTLEAGPDTARWELLRALGAAVLTPPPASAGVWEALELDAPSGAEYTEVLVLGAPPHAAIHLGPEGQLGGEGLDRVAGFWRALGLTPREDADHLGALLLLYAEIGAAADTTSEPSRADQLERTRVALFHEHLWSWAPGYLAAVSSMGVDSLTAWANLLGEALRAELEAVGPRPMPLALRQAPAPLQPTGTLDEALDTLVSPVRSGFVLTQADLRLLAHAAGVGFRRGERRFALKAMLEQDARATLTGLADHASTWAVLHQGRGADNRFRPVGDACGAWWAERANHTSATIEDVLADVERTA